MTKTTPYLLLLIIVICSLTTSCQSDKNDHIDQRVAEIVSQIKEPVIPDRTINLIEFSGHKPDANGRYDFRSDIQRAIAELSSLGGGTLLFPNSAPDDSWLRYQETYRIRGPIELADNIRLLLENSVKLFFEFDPPSYLPNGRPVLTRYEGTTLYTFSPCFRAFGVKNVVIESAGSSGAMPVINGDGEKWQRWMWQGEGRHVQAGDKPSYQRLKALNNAGVPVRELVMADPDSHFFRPPLMQFFMCENIKVQGIKITNSPFWCIHPVFSQNVIVRDVLFDAYVVNNDGVDPESSLNILIENVMFNNHDDNVAIKAGRDREGREGADISGTELQGVESRYIKGNRLGGPTENVVIRNCVFKGHYAIAIGSEMSGGVHDVFAIDNLSVQDVNMGFFIKSSRTRGGEVHDIFVRNLQLNRVDGDVISMIPNYDNDATSPYPPLFHDIYLQDISARQAKYGIRIYGWSDAPVQHVQLKNIRINNVAKEELVLVQAENIELQNVAINGDNKDGHYTKRDFTSNVPHQI